MFRIQGGMRNVGMRSRHHKLDACAVQGLISAIPAKGVQAMGDEDNGFEPQTREFHDAANAWLDEGYTGRQIRGFLAEKGLSEESAALIVANVAAARHVARRKAGERNMAIGALWLVIGIVVSAATYDAAGEGVTYLVAWGAILFGGIQFLRGLAQHQGRPEESSGARASVGQPEA